MSTGENLTGITARLQPSWAYDQGMAVQLDLDYEALNAEGIRAARRLVITTTRRVFNRSQVLCPVDEGYLRSSGAIDPVVVTGSTVRSGVTYSADYAAAVHNGRRALTIRAKGNGRLRFTGEDGRTIYVRQVYQPARPARPFLSTALTEVAAGQGFRVVTIG